MAILGTMTMKTIAGCNQLAAVLRRLIDHFGDASMKLEHACVLMKR